MDQSCFSEYARPRNIGLYANLQEVTYSWGTSDNKENGSARTKEHDRCPERLHRQLPMRCSMKRACSKDSHQAGQRFQATSLKRPFLVGAEQ